MAPEAPTRGEQGMVRTGVCPPGDRGRGTAVPCSETSAISSPPNSPDCRPTDIISGQGHTGYVHGVVVSPNGKQLASNSADKTIRVWDLSSGQCIATLEVCEGRGPT